MCDKGYSFECDKDKMQDMLLLTRDEFLNLYKYLTIDDYFSTVKNIVIEGASESMGIIVTNKLYPLLKINRSVKFQFIKFAKSFEEFDMLVEKYLNENIRLGSLENEITMKQFYANAVNDFHTDS